ncbi:serine/threonine-protein kinase RIO3 [Musca domestica]|uniref:non-specific serine/threonine protein kinase n=1 Tax=Musca domestica TaxID=7370 RepID=A0A1I8ML05_MUSDO|nr:serine/threonine-protein kinase RIO3 [Musca domestica]
MAANNNNNTNNNQPLPMTSSNNCWGTVPKPIVEDMNFAAIVKNQKKEKVLKQATEREKRKQQEERDLEEALVKSLEMATMQDAQPDEDEDEWDLLNEEDDFKFILPPEVLEFLKSEEEELAAAEKAALEGCESDAVIAQMLQAQFDKEYNEEVKRIEKAQNKQSKITVCLDKYIKPYIRDVGEDLESDDYEEDEIHREKRDWDRFETNERILEAIPKCGYGMDKDGEMITKHDEKLCGVRNACRMMSLPLEFATGDGAGFDMKLSNRVFNELKTYSRKGQKKNARMQDRKDNVATAEMGVDGRTRLILYKLINNLILEQINGIISTGKEAVILHANSDPAFVGPDPENPLVMPKECAVKIFKTTLNDFKQRDRYIKDDYRFKGRFNVRFGKQNNFVIINMWAEKEMHNLTRMQSVGINCPEVVMLKKHVLVMSFIGENNKAAPKLKDAILSAAQWIAAYDEVVTAMYKLYNEAKLVHADLSEYNILWHDDKCWFIDVAQSVEPQHPSALEFLMRDCNNIVSFFEKKGVPNCHTKEQLFEHITSLNAETINVAMLERIHTKGANIQLATAPNQDECPLEAKPLEYPFDLAWEKTMQNAANVDCKVQAALVENAKTESSMPQPIIVNSLTDTANI